MELRLEQMIDALETVSNIRNLQANNPQIMRLSHPTNATVHVIVCALEEPYTQVLPLNVTWFNYNPESDYYRRALRRVSKKPTDGGFNHTWEVIDTYDEVFVNQEYDAIDTAYLTNVQAVPPASVTELGTVKLSVTPADPANPKAVVEGDPRLTDARPPTSHSHAQVPAQQLKTSVGNVTISGSAAPVVGSTLIATSASSAEWRRLKSTDVQ